MQHHGVPTRLLDWSETFAVALFFALRGAVGDAAVWILDPYKLNEVVLGCELLPRPTELDGEYSEFFIDSTKQLGPAAVAIAPLRHNPRIHRQRGGFTLHRDLTLALDELCPAAVKKVEIPLKLHPEASEFLRLAGVSEFSLFPDLDGLARDICNEHFPDNRQTVPTGMPLRIAAHAT